MEFLIELLKNFIFVSPKKFINSWWQSKGVLLFRWKLFVEGVHDDAAQVLKHSVHLVMVIFFDPFVHLLSVKLQRNQLKNFKIPADRMGIFWHFENLKEFLQFLKGKFLEMLLLFWSLIEIWIFKAWIIRDICIHE